MPGEVRWYHVSFALVLIRDWDGSFFIFTITAPHTQTAGTRTERSQNMIKLEHISKTFDTAAGNVHAVRDVSLDIRDGEILGII